MRIPPGKTLHLDTGSGSSPHELGPDLALGSVIGMLTSEAAAGGVGRLPASARQVIGHRVNLPSVSCFWEENWPLPVKPNTFRGSALFRSSFAPHTSYCNVLFSPSPHFCVCLIITHPPPLAVPFFISFPSLHLSTPHSSPVLRPPPSSSPSSSPLAYVVNQNGLPQGSVDIILKQKKFFHSSSPLHVFPAASRHPLCLNLLPGAKKQHGIRETCTRHARCDYGPYPSRLSIPLVESWRVLTPRTGALLPICFTLPFFFPCPFNLSFFSPPHCSMISLRLSPLQRLSSSVYISLPHARR